MRDTEDWLWPYVAQARREARAAYDRPSACPHCLGTGHVLGEPDTGLIRVREP